MAQLGQDNFDWQIEQAEWGWLDLVTGGLSGASSGLGLWNSWNAAQQYADGKSGAASAAAGGAGSEVKSTQTMYSYTPTATPAPSLDFAIPAADWETIFDFKSGYTNPFTVSLDKYTAFNPYDAMGANLRASMGVLK
jgi:hypothetical protein